jgi:hypothetical protein
LSKATYYILFGKSGAGFFIFEQICKMKGTLITLLLFSVFMAIGQQSNFPSAWAGHWKGDLQWYKTGKAEPQTVNMELRISPSDSGSWNWQIIYGKETEDNRPYKLIKKDSVGVHWAIDERNGIVLDQYWTANRFSGAFTVMANTIFNTYYIENGKLMVEFFSISAKPTATTGLGTAEHPSVDSYRLGSYQKAILTKVE